jgi:hypothetical protein
VKLKFDVTDRQAAKSEYDLPPIFNLLALALQVGLYGTVAIDNTGVEYVIVDIC